MLEVKIAETARYVDEYVLLESSVSTTGHQKPLHFEEARQRFSMYESKISHVKLNESGPGPDSWAREAYMRHNLFTGLRNVRDGDVVIVTDVDELVRPEILRSLKECTGYEDRGNFLQFLMKLYYYSFNLVHPSPWNLVKGTIWNTNRNLTANDVRGASQIAHVFHDSGWHCSCCFSTIRAVRNKIKHYTHTELTGNPAVSSKEHIVRVVRRGEDLYDRSDQRYTFIEPTDVPKYVLANAVRFSYMLDRRGPTAGFLDFLD